MRAPGSAWFAKAVTVLSGSDLELGAAAMVDPNAVAVVSPAIAEAARRFANLLHDLDSAASIYRAILAVANIG